MKLSTKLTLGYASIILLVGIIVGVVYNQLSEVKTISQDVAEYRVVVQNTAQDISLQFVKQTAAQRAYFSSGNNSITMS